MVNEAVKELECQTVQGMVACLEHKGIFKFFTLLRF